MKRIPIYFFVIVFLLGSLYFGVQGMLLMKFNEEIESVQEAIPEETLKNKKSSTQVSGQTSENTASNDSSKVQVANKNEPVKAKENLIRFDGFVFKNHYELKLFLKGRAIEEFIHCKSFINFPSYFLLLITSVSFSCLGATTLVIRKELVGKGEGIIQTLMCLTLGILTGFIILALAELIPTLLVESEGQIRPTTLVFMAFFGGLYMERFFEWIDGRFGTIFKSGTS